MTEPISFDDWKARCSSISKLLSTSQGYEGLTDLQEKELVELDQKAESGKITDKQRVKLAYLVDKQEKGKEPKLGDIAVSYLLEAYAWETEQMCSITKEMDVEYFDRGRKTEPESIELLSFVDDTPYGKNERRFENEFLSGIPDLIGRPSEIDPIGRIRDIKSCRDLPIFLYKIHKGLDAGNAEQVAGYGDIFGIHDLAVAFTLPTMPEEMRNGYKMKLAYKMNAAIDHDPEFEKAWANLERSMIFDQMDPRQRVYKIPVAPFTSFERQAVYDRVKIGRDWLNNFHQSYQKLNK